MRPISHILILAGAVLVGTVIVTMGGLGPSASHAAAPPSACANPAIELDLTDARLVRETGNVVEHIVSVQLTDTYVLATKASGAMVVIRREALRYIEDEPPRR